MRVINGKKIVDMWTANGQEVRNWVEIAGLSTETKPVVEICTGSVFREVDTGNEYVFAEEAMAWLGKGKNNTVTGATVTLGTALTWDGTLLSQTVSSVKVGNTTLTAGTDYELTENHAVEPGTYTLYIVGKGTYMGMQAKAFTVSKAQGSVTASPDTLSLTEGGEAGTSALTVVGDGALTVESSDETAATASVAFVEPENENESGSWVVTVTPGSAGSATVTVSLAATDHYLAGSDTISVTVAAAEAESEGE